MEKEYNKKQVYFTLCSDDEIIFMMVVGGVLFELGNETENLLMVTIDSGNKLIDIHDQRLWL
ncbi:hypothetical protein HP475_10950 [Serratia marcescens]|uniref:hypothetical protein n=1 Tax=Serratia marcescens TaxID=615 RepID=UPI000665B942|nr:hypothetical protein [Serratia marcescens]QLJ60404.1 hypothetical protein HP475_10950 [Serratia marcescens]HAX9712366.1 hypothetical protein [Serratia marcescens]